MRRFFWIVPGDIPRSQDLRLCGWRMAPACGDGIMRAVQANQPALILVSAPRMGPGEWRLVFDAEFNHARRFVIVLDVDSTDERVRILEAGVGDAFAPEIFLGELSTRCKRALKSAQMLPHMRKIGALQLDLFARDAFAHNRPLGLHPREFALLWRLAQSPGQAVAKADLVAQVWRQSFVPDTNSLAVHVSRLRAKLAVAGFDGLIETRAAGSYALRNP